MLLPLFLSINSSPSTCPVWGQTCTSSMFFILCLLTVNLSPSPVFFSLSQSLHSLTLNTCTTNIWVIVQGSVNLIPQLFTLTIFCWLLQFLHTTLFLPLCPSIHCLVSNRSVRVWQVVASSFSCQMFVHSLCNTWPVLHQGRPSWCVPVVPGVSQDGQKPAAVWAGLPAGQVPLGSGAPLHCFLLWRSESRRDNNKVCELLHDSHGTFGGVQQCRAAMISQWISC